MATIKLTNVIKRFQETETIHGVNLDLEDGEFVVFVGPSGCGKSTLLRLIAGLEDITDGELHIDGKIMNSVAPAERGVAMVFQSYALYPHMTVKDNMSFGLRMTGSDPEYIESRVQEAAEILHLDKLLDRKPKALSGGQRQRVAIGRAIVREPKVFLFDEPLSNLDAELRVDMRVQIAKLHNQLKSTMVYVTHDQVEAMTLADKIVVLRDGNIEQVGSPMALYHNPANEFVAGFIGSPKMNFLKGKITHVIDGKATISVSGQSITLHIKDQNQVIEGDTVSLGIRPEHLAEFNSESDIKLNVNIDVAEHLGGTSFLYATCGDESLTIEVSGQNMSRSGELLEIGAKLSDCYLFDSKGNSLITRPVPTR
ncbi:ABC transporter ATP-binding protein [Marinomonas balearica]|uniref:Carbohydrate ABC transporter ATP-binding protein (CUT1 family) n=1 Tax=Marinomonas balearica TaxID=491947 RepID=A0A4R6M3E4_9GAMM|nr:sn-glycerol-3-phosphate ABC transporter ATP-binding protein UgpC [Marinomonas balearica]TDO95808.1 carbohydrate ABC transporter ATP-binding protein (CUT1 family) [Marinomonas balearica]